VPPADVFQQFFDLIPWGGLLLRLSSKPLCDGASSDLGVFFVISDGGFGVDANQRRVLASTEELKNLFVISIFVRVLCVSWVGQLSFLYPSSRCLYLDRPMYVFLNV
jgi:hypothetical protein